MISSAPTHPHAHGTSSASTTGIAAMLKERTSDHHHRAEQHPLQQALMRGGMDRETWGVMVAQNRVIQEALEKALDSAAGREARLGKVFAPHHRRLGKFDADLKALGTPAAACAANPAAAKGMAWIGSLAQREPIALLGVLYVLEGATNGGQYIARPLSASLGIASNAPGLLSLNPHGDQTRELWGGFRSSINSISLTEQESDAIIAAAGETFDLIGRVLDGILRKA